MRRPLAVVGMFAVVAIVATFSIAGANTDPPVDNAFLKNVFTQAGNCPNWACARNAFHDAGAAIPTATTQPPVTTVPATTVPPTTTQPPATTIPPTTTTQPAPSFLFDDEFNGSSLDTSVWWAKPWCANDPNYAAMCFNANNVSVSGGNLHLKVTNGTMGRTYDGAQINTFVEGSWPPATVKAAVAPPVHMEVRAKVAPGAGIWPAFWPESVDPTFIELDIMEMRMVDPTFDGNHLHGMASFDGGINAGIDLSADFHVYWANYYPDHITFGLDGTTGQTVQFSKSAPRVGFVLGNQVGTPGTWGGEGGPPPSSAIPADMLVDYARAWAI